MPVVIKYNPRVSSGYKTMPCHVMWHVQLGCKYFMSLLLFCCSDHICALHGTYAGMSSPVVHSQGSAYDVFILYVTFSKEMPENIIFVILLLHFRTEHLVSVMSHLKELSISLKSQYKQASNLYISGNTLFVYFKWRVMTLLLSKSADLLNNSVMTRHLK